MGRITLGPDEHIEWSMLSKLARVNSNRNAIKQRWPSLEIKLETLRTQARGGKLIGIAANELLEVGGHKNLMWIDIDYSNFDRIGCWLKEQRLFPKGSYLHIRSSTWNSHIYVVTDTPLREDNQLGMKRYIKARMPADLAKHLDRVYGPESCRIIFLPMPSLLSAELPQHMTNHLTEIFHLPVNDILGVVDRIALLL